LAQGHDILPAKRISSLYNNLIATIQNVLGMHVQRRESRRCYKRAYRYTLHSPQIKISLHHVTNVTSLAVCGENIPLSTTNPMLPSPNVSRFRISITATKVQARVRMLI